MHRTLSARRHHIPASPSIDREHPDQYRSTYCQRVILRLRDRETSSDCSKAGWLCADPPHRAAAAPTCRATLTQRQQSHILEDVSGQSDAFEPHHQVDSSQSQYSPHMYSTMFYGLAFTNEQIHLSLCRGRFIAPTADLSASAHVRM